MRDAAEQGAVQRAATDWAADFRADDTQSSNGWGIARSNGGWGFSETSNEGVGFGLGFASTMDAAACGTVGEGDFYWGGLASTLFWVDPVEDLYVIFMTQLIPSSTFNFRGQIKNIVYGALRAA